MSETREREKGLETKNNLPTVHVCSYYSTVLQVPLLQVLLLTTRYVRTYRPSLLKKENTALLKKSNIIQTRGTMKAVSRIYLTKGNTRRQQRVVKVTSAAISIQHQPSAINKRRITLYNKQETRIDRQATGHRSQDHSFQRFRQAGYNKFKNYRTLTYFHTRR